MAAKSRESVKDSDKVKVDELWKNVLKTEGDKRKAEFMQHQYANDYLTEFTSIFMWLFGFGRFA